MEEYKEFDKLIFPMAKRVFAKTLSSDIGGFASKEEITELKSEILKEQRESKIESIIEDKEYKEQKMEDDPRYKELMSRGVKPMSAPKGELFYLDFKYDDKENKDL
jgi:hypothetical protein